MAITLADARNLSQSKLTHYVIDEFRKSALLDMLTFDNTVKPQSGKTMAYVYNRVTTLPTAAGRELNTEYAPDDAKTEQQVVNLKPFGGSFSIDRVIQENETEVVDYVDFQMKQKTQATIALFHDWFINGDSAVDRKAFDGLSKAITGSSTEITPDGIIDLSSAEAIEANWKKFIYSFRALRGAMDGAPSVYLMSSSMFSAFQTVLDYAGQNTTKKAEYGDECLQWGPSLLMAMGDKPGTSDPIIGSDGDDGTTSIYGARLALDGVHAVSPEGSKLVKTYLPDFTRPGAVKVGEVEMIAAMAVKTTRAASALRGIKI